MARVGNVPTVSAYKGNIGQQLMHVGNTLDDISQKYERKQEVELAQAKKLYTQGLNINLYNSINELRNNPNLSANPQGLASAMDEVLNKTLQDVDDNDVKMAVMVDYQLKKNTYVNKAQTEFDRIQRAKAKSYAYDSVYANIDSMGASFANAFTGNMTEDDVANFQHSLANIKANINATNPDGTYVFTDAQRRAMMRDAQSTYLQGFKGVFEQLDEKQQNQVEKELDDDSIVVLSTQSKDNPEETADISLRDVVGDDSYDDIKKYVKKYNRAALAEREKERKYQGRLAVEDFLDNPSKVTFDKLQEMNPEMSEKTMEKYREIYENTPDYEATTVFDGVNDAKDALAEIKNLDEGGVSDNSIFLDRTANYVRKLQRSNAQGKLSSSDVNKYANLAYRAANDKIFGEQVNGIFGKPNAFSRAASWVGSGMDQQVKNIGLETIQATTDALLNDDPETAEKIYQEGQKRAIQTRYPDINFTKLKEGDIIWYRGRAIKFMGYSLDDILVEVDPNTGAVK